MVIKLATCDGEVPFLGPVCWPIRSNKDVVPKLTYINPHILFPHCLATQPFLTHPRSSHGYVAATIDKVHQDGRMMDFNTPPGFLFLGQAILMDINACATHYSLLICNMCLHPRLTLHTVLCLFPDSVCLLGPNCGSWGIPARYTTMRPLINSWGAMHLPFVQDANTMISLKLGFKQIHVTNIMWHTTAST